MHSYASPGHVVTVPNSGPGAVAVRVDQPYRLRGLVGVTQHPAAVDEDLNLCVEGQFFLPVVLAAGVAAVAAGELVHLKLDGSWTLVAGLSDTAGHAPFGFLGERISRSRPTLVKVAPLRASSLMFGTPSGYDAATGKTNALPLPVDESQFLVSVADGAIYRRVSFTATVFLPPTFTPQVITYKRWEPVSAALNLKLQTPTPNSQIAQAANADGSLLVPIIHPSVTSNPAFVNGRRFTPSSGAKYVELKPEAGRVRIEGLLNGITGGTAADYVKIVAELSADDGATWQPSNIALGFDTADARVADSGRFRSEPISAPNNGIVRISVRYVSTAAAQFYVNNIWLKAA